MTRRTSTAIAVLLYLVGFAAIGAGIPADGLVGAALAGIGMIAIWFGWYLVIRRARRSRADRAGMQAWADRLSRGDR